MRWPHLLSPPQPHCQHLPHLPNRSSHSPPPPQACCALEWHQRAGPALEGSQERDLGLPESGDHAAGQPGASVLWVPGPGLSPVPPAAPGLAQARSLWIPADRGRPGPACPPRFPSASHPQGQVWAHGLGLGFADPALDRALGGEWGAGGQPGGCGHSPGGLSRYPQQSVGPSAHSQERCTPAGRRGGPGLGRVGSWSMHRTCVPAAVWQGLPRQTVPTLFLSADIRVSSGCCGRLGAACPPRSWRTRGPSCAGEGRRHVGASCGVGLGLWEGAEERAHLPSACPSWGAEGGGHSWHRRQFSKGVCVCACMRGGA